LTGGLFWRKKLNESGTIASDLCEYSEEIARIAHLAFKSAQNRRQSDVVDKANVLETSFMEKGGQ
jgi:3-isopropylmalate dehydrogenase